MERYGNSFLLFFGDIMKLDELTIGDAKQLAGMFGTTGDGPWKVGTPMLIRTVTNYWTGRIVQIFPCSLVLEDAAWIADTGRFSEALTNGIETLGSSEIEPAQKLPILNPCSHETNAAGRGVHGISDTHRPQLGDAFSKGRGVHGNDAAGTCERRQAWLVDWFSKLRDRLRTVRVCCGDWERVCGSPSVTTRLGATGIFLDPPYPTHAPDGSKSRDDGLYSGDDRDALDVLRDRVLAYCIEHGPNREFRIAVCGYDTDGYATLEALGWDCVAWKASGGYGNQSGAVNVNAGRERIWFSPHCLKTNRQRQGELL